MAKLSVRQEEILAFIKEEVKKKGYPPSVREIGEAVGLASSSTVHGHLARLERKGCIRRDPTKPRAIEILSVDEQPSDDAAMKRDSAHFIPVIGQVTAGLPITAVENIEDYLPIPEHLIGHDNTYALIIQGDSMIEAGIFDGDQVIIRQQQTADNGDIVVAMTEENEATVKRFFQENDHIRLQPENSTMEPILLDHCTILGKVIGLFRAIR